MAIRKIFISNGNDSHSIEAGLSVKGQLVCLIVHNSSGNQSSNMVIKLSPNDALELCKEIKQTINLLKQGGQDGARS